MNVKEAVLAAKAFIADLYQDESPQNIGLEEVEFNSAQNEWIVTIGFSRPWEEPKSAFAAIAAASTAKRSYKIVRIADATGEVLSVKNRDFKA